MTCKDRRVEGRARPRACGHGNTLDLTLCFDAMGAV